MTRVREFHRAMGHAAPALPPLEPDQDLLRLRLRLIAEEYAEVTEAIKAMIYRTGDSVELLGLYRDLLKELADLRYVVEGCAVALALPIDEAFVLVHESNMSKLDDEGKPVYDAGGKVLKGPNYLPPDMKNLIPDYIEEIS